MKVFLCDDHKLFREGLRKILELKDDIEIVGEASNGQEAIDRIKKAHPDIVLMDIGMPEMDGMSATYKIKKEIPRVNIIILTVYQDEPHIFEAIKAGAIGYLLKDISSDELIEAICRVYKGEALIQPSIATKVLKEFITLSKKKEDKERYTGLTERENEILKLITLGNGNKEIASKLYISEKTVKNHISNIFQKLHVNSRTQAALYALGKMGISARF